MAGAKQAGLDGLIIPDKIPGEDLRPDLLRSAVSGMRSSAGVLTEGAGSVESGWSGMPAVFVSPDSAPVYSAMVKPVTAARDVAARLGKVADAVSDFADRIEPMKRDFDAIRVDAAALVTEIGPSGMVWMSPAQTKAYEGDSQAFAGSGAAYSSAGYGASSGYVAPPYTQSDAMAYLRGRGESVRTRGGAIQILAPWQESGAHVDRNNRLLDRVADVYARLSEAEADCANAIGRQRNLCMVEAVPVEAWQLKQSGDSRADLPWGHRVDEDRNCGESFWWGAGNAGREALVGLGGLIGYDGVRNDGTFSLDAAGQAWGGLFTSVGTIVAMGSPVAWVMAGLGHQGVQLTLANGVEMGKSLVAWDTWSKNPAEAAGTTLVNVGSFFLPGAGTVGAVLKIATTGTKLGFVASAVGKLESIAGKVREVTIGKVFGVGEHVTPVIRGADDVAGSVGSKVDANLGGVGGPGGGVHVRVPDAEGHAPSGVGHVPEGPGSPSSGGAGHVGDGSGGAGHGSGGTGHGSETGHAPDGSGGAGHGAGHGPETGGTPDGPGAGPGNGHGDGPGHGADSDNGSGNGHAPDGNHTPETGPTTPREGVGSGNSTDPSSPSYNPDPYHHAGSLPETQGPVFTGKEPGPDDHWVRNPDKDISPPDYGQVHPDAGQVESYYRKQDTPLAPGMKKIFANHEAAPWGWDEHGKAIPNQREWDLRYAKPDKLDGSDGGVRWPGNDGAVNGTKVLYSDRASLLKDYPDLEGLDRIGREGGDYLTAGGTPFEQRGLTPGHASMKITEYRIADVLPDNIKIEVSLIAPANGFPGGGLQVRFWGVSTEGKLKFLSVSDLKSKQYGVLV